MNLPIPSVKRSLSLAKESENFFTSCVKEIISSWSMTPGDGEIVPSEELFFGGDCIFSAYPSIASWNSLIITFETFDDQTIL